jgi:hypothetical protein
MKLFEILDLEPQKEKIKSIKQNAKQQVNYAKVALERLRMLRDQKKLEQTKQLASTTP